jgi:two-component system cell cycle sensor histidine kinase/response regulator CckA
MEQVRKPVILNVDDDDAGRYATTEVLLREGFEVVEARTGEETLELVRRNPDLVLLDLDLPGISGLDVCRRIKTDPETRDIPVVFLSATATTQDDRIRGLEHGGDAYLTAPIAPELLAATIRAFLRTRRAEAQARSAAREWQATFDAVQHGICLLDREGRIVRANRAFADILGKEPAELVGMSRQQAFPEAEAPPGGWPFERTRVSKRRESAEVRVGDRWFEVIADPLLDSNGEFTGAVRTISDVTWRRKAEMDRDLLVRELERGRERLQMVLDQMPAGVILAEAPSGRVLLANDRVNLLWSKPWEAGETIFNLVESIRSFRPDGRPYRPGEWPLERSIDTGETVTNEEIEIVGEDRRRVWVLASSTPVRDRNGFVVAGILTLQDITGRKQLEEQFRQAQKMEAIGRLAGGVAHDFNNLLTIIGGYGQMLLDTTNPEDPIHKDLEAIMEAANRAGALTRQLLTVSRRQVVQPKTFELNRLITRTNRMLKRVIGEDVELVHALESERGRIKADPGQIEQVLLNLAINARDAMPTGGRLTIETADIEIGQDTIVAGQTLKAGKYVLLAVSDTGTGMTPEVMKHVFEPFFTTKPRGKGTGLGLSTVYGIVTQTGGVIAVDSEAGRGTAIRIYFPAAAAGRGGQQETERELGRADSSSAGGRETILVVEDEADVRRLAAEMLARLGYNVLEAQSGAEAVRLWEENRDAIDLVLTDVVMPRMSGQELAATLQQARPGTRVMFMSGYTDDVVARHGGIDRAKLLHKPFTSDSLARMVRSVLDSRS